jgi:hypothetical protein
MHIFFTYNRPSEDMQVAAECARIYSPKSQVVELLSPKSERSERYRSLAKLIPTVNPHIHELECLLRWIHLLDFMEASQLSEVFACDVDVLVFQDMEQEASGFLKQFDYTLGDNRSGLYAAGSSLIRLPVLQEFVEFLFRRDGVESHDMSAWTEFRVAHPEFKCGIHNRVHDGSAYDFNIGADLDLYESEPVGPNSRQKKIVFHHGIPYGRLLNTGEEIRFKVLHCWAWSRSRMREYVETGKKSFGQRSR